MSSPGNPSSWGGPNVGDSFLLFGCENLQEPLLDLLFQTGDLLFLLPGQLQLLADKWWESVPQFETWRWSPAGQGPLGSLARAIARLPSPRTQQGPKGQATYQGPFHDCSPFHKPQYREANKPRPVQFLLGVESSR